MDGILITGGKCIGMIVSPDRPMSYFEQIGRLGLDMQKVNLGASAPMGAVWVDTGSDLVQAMVIDALGPAQ